jgi:hypothetical protein
MPRHEERTAPAECPVCGTAVPPKAVACPHCGADERTGWNDDAARYDGLDLPDAAFEDEADDGRNHRPARKPLRAGPHPVWIAIGLGLLVWFTYLAISPF